MDWKYSVRFLAGFDGVCEIPSRPGFPLTIRQPIKVKFYLEFQGNQPMGRMGTCGCSLTPTFVAFDIFYRCVSAIRQVFAVSSQFRPFFRKPETLRFAASTDFDHPIQ